MRDGYEGFIETGACDYTNVSATHWVSTKATLVFDKPDIKSTVVQRLLFGSELTLSDAGVNRDFLKLGNSGFIWASHCTDINTSLGLSLIEIAQSNYLHAPYLWGGRSTNACDCSGLVQMVARAKGISLPRDSVDQETALISDVKYANRAAEDLVYWLGHVGILKSPELLLHATAHSMRCCIEPLTHVMQRAGSPCAIKRISKQEQKN